MFESELKKKELKSFHPLVIAVKKEIKNHRESVDSIPECKIHLQLPIPVQTSPDSIIKKGKKNLDGGVQVFFLLIGYESAYTKTIKTDQSIAFVVQNCSAMLVTGSEKIEIWQFILLKMIALFFCLLLVIC